MKICPIAIAVGCPKCPAFKACPAKGILGGYKDSGFTADGLVYDINTDQYQSVPRLPIGLSGLESVRAAGAIFALGGEDKMRGRTARVLQGRFK